MKATLCQFEGTPGDEVDRLMKDFLDEMRRRRVQTTMILMGDCGCCHMGSNVINSRARRLLANAIERLDERGYDDDEEGEEAVPDEARGTTH